MRPGSDPTEDWARTASLPTPIRWGALEDEVLSRRPPPAADQTTADKVIRMIGLALMGLLAIPTFGSSVVGLVLFLVGVNPIVLRVLFVLAIGASTVMLMFWWEDRDRSPVKLLVAGGSGAVSLATYLMMRGAPEADGDTWAALLMLVAAAVGLVGALVMLVGAKSDQNRPRRRRRSFSPAKDVAYMRSRRRVLEVLVERGLVDVDVDRQKQIAEMPLGTWHTLDQSTQR